MINHNIKCITYFEAEDKSITPVTLLEGIDKKTNINR